MFPEKKLVLFDMDGTLIPSYMDREKGQAYGHVELLPGRRERLGDLALRDVQLGIVTNQGGAAFGYQSVDECHRKVELVIEMLGVPMTMWIALGHEKAKVPELKWGGGRRKPAPTMLLEAMRHHGIAEEDTLFVGDMKTDMEAAHWARIDFCDEEAFFSVS